MSDFWDHLLNAAGHMLDAGRMREAEQQAQRQAAAEQRAKARAKAGERKAAPANAGAFASGPSSASNNDPGCCVRRRFKVE